MLWRICLILAAALTFELATAWESKPASLDGGEAGLCGDEGPRSGDSGPRCPVSVHVHGSRR
jgi:hypothetical protein